MAMEASIRAGQLAGVRDVPAGRRAGVLLAGRRLRLGWLDDVRGGGLGRVRGILAAAASCF